jgi:hypothetical protein
MGVQPRRDSRIATKRGLQLILESSSVEKSQQITKVELFLTPRSQMQCLPPRRPQKTSKKPTSARAAPEASSANSASAHRSTIYRHAHATGLATKPPSNASSRRPDPANPRPTPSSRLFASARNSTAPGKNLPEPAPSYARPQTKVRRSLPLLPRPKSLPQILIANRRLERDASY